jgi:hypothetical protein
MLLAPHPLSLANYQWNHVLQPRVLYPDEPLHPPHPLFLWIYLCCRRNDAATPKKHANKAELSPIRSQQSVSPHSREGSKGYLQYSARGGKFSVSNPKSDVEWKILRAAQIPGPGSYGAAPLRMGGGKFSTCKPKSDTDWIVLRASQIPAPGQYKLPDTTLVSGGKFSQSRPKTSLDWAIYNGKKTPGMYVRPAN